MEDYDYTDNTDYRYNFIVYKTEIEYLSIESPRICKYLAEINYKNGELYEHYSYDKNFSLCYRTTRYFNNKILTNEDFITSEKTVYSYYEDGRLEKIITTNSKNDIISCLQLFYDLDKKVLKEVYYERGYEKISLYDYNTFGKEIEIRNYEGDLLVSFEEVIHNSKELKYTRSFNMKRELQDESFIHYHDNCRPRLIENINSKAELLHSIRFIYDSNEKLAYVEFRNLEFNIYWEIYYLYNDLGLLKQQKDVEYHNNLKTKETIIYYEYV